MPNKVAMLKVKDIRDNPAALRQVDLDSGKYKAIVKSAAVSGILNAINVRVVHDELENVDFFQLVDGLHRLTAAREVMPDGEIPCVILDVGECEAYAAQIIGNLMRVDTKPAAYTGQLLRILAARPNLTPGDLAAMIGETPEWVVARLSLKDLNPAIAPLVDDGTIKVTNAIALARLDKDEQLNWADRASSEAPAVFQPAVSKRLGEIRAAAKAGLPVGPPTFAPVAKVRGLAVLKSAAAGELDAGLFEGPSREVAITTVKWVLSLDDESVAAAQQAWTDAQAKKSKEKLLAASERAAKKVADSTKAQEEVRKRLIAAGIAPDVASTAGSEAAG